ncbi:CDP-alcohol phosphatidyltransferase family protein [Candidatus Woesearchaeota archaeon]|nr:CDP-alcohol phosphatidyltransferase family protein [Candidatus Woesearchaeota archaeon]
MLYKYRNWLYNTNFSRAISKLVILKISPNLITFFGLVFGVIAAYLIYKHYLLLAIIPLVLSGLCDLCDGWVARLSNKETKFGVIFDVTLDKYVEGFVGLGFSFVTPGFLVPGYIWVIIAVFGSIIISLVSNVGAALSQEKPFKLASRFDRGVIIVLGLILANFLGDIYLTYTAVFVAAITHLTVVSLVISYYKILKNKK